MSGSGSILDLSVEEARERLRVDYQTMQALSRSGLLGNLVNGHVLRIAVDHYERYGTQWRPDLGRRDYPSSIALKQRGIPHHPSNTDLWAEILWQPPPSQGTNSASIVQFYLRPNVYYFCPPMTTATVGPLGLKLSSPRRVVGTSNPITIFPDPEDSIAMVSAHMPSAGRDAYDQAYDQVAPILDELSLEFDQPLRIVQTISIGIPTGTISLSLSQPSDAKELQPTFTIAVRPPVGLEVSEALYRDGISTSNPFHQFLTLYKCYENLVEVRGNWRLRKRGKRGDPRGDVLVEPETFPDQWAFKGFVGTTFAAAREKLWTPIRCAVAHGNTQPKSAAPKTAATAEDYLGVLRHVPIVRHMARVALLNFRATMAMFGP